jgi:hypothetical protein
MKCAKQRPLRGGESRSTPDSLVPLGDGGENRKRQFATKTESSEPAIHYALTIFFAELRLCSGNSRIALASHRQVPAKSVKR